MLRPLLLALVAMAACSNPDSEAAREAKFRKDLAAASVKARAQLPFFWQHYEAPEPDEYDFLLKVAMPAPGEGKGEEHVWVEQMQKGDKEITGLVASSAEPLALKKGDEIAFEERKIADWAFFSGEQLLGHYTTRVMLPRMPPDQAEAMRSMLGENPG